MADRLFLAWQDKESRSWHTIGLLTCRGDSYEFTFTMGAKHLRSVPAALFHMEPGNRFVSNRLMPLFQNKIPPKNRADFAKIAGWVGLKGDEDEFTLLARFGMISGTDGLMVYPEPQVQNCVYSIDFFAHGIRHMHIDAIESCERLAVGDHLLPMLDVKNPVDPFAVALRCQRENLILGYVPTFYAHDIYHILRNSDSAKGAHIYVVRNNSDAPIQLRLMCRFTAKVDANFEPLRTDDQQPFFFREKETNDQPESSAAKRRLASLRPA